VESQRVICENCDFNNHTLYNYCGICGNQLADEVVDIRQKRRGNGVGTLAPGNTSVPTAISFYGGLLSILFFFLAAITGIASLFLFFDGDFGLLIIALGLTVLFAYAGVRLPERLKAYRNDARYITVTTYGILAVITAIPIINELDSRWVDRAFITFMSLPFILGASAVYFLMFHKPITERFS
jgi:hypothetical protein